MIQVGIALLLIGISLYRTHFKRDIRMSAISVIFVHALVLWGLYDITGNIKYSVVAVAIITAIFGASTITFAFQTRRDFIEIYDVRISIRELYARIWAVLDGKYDPFEFIIQFDGVYDKINTLHDDESKKLAEKILSIISTRRNVFALPEIKDYAVKNNVPKKKWWFYLAELDASNI